MKKENLSFNYYTPVYVYHYFIIIQVIKFFFIFKANKLFIVNKPTVFQFLRKKNSKKYSINEIWN